MDHYTLAAHQLNAQASRELSREVEHRRRVAERAGTLAQPPLVPQSRVTPWIWLSAHLHLHSRPV